MARSGNRTDLSGAERKVLGLVAEGLTNDQIALRLGKRPGTVKAQLASARHVLGVPTRSAAAAWWVKNGDSQTANSSNVAGPAWTDSALTRLRLARDLAGKASAATREARRSWMQGVNGQPDTADIPDPFSSRLVAAEAAAMALEQDLSRLVRDASRGSANGH
jgi:DNA-binding CsgD family transcriptional regulator